jgi:hypothetical protein
MNKTVLFLDSVSVEPLAKFRPQPLVVEPDNNGLLLPL